MSRHAAPRVPLHRRLASVPIRLLLAAGALLALGSAGTLAYWNDSATVSSAQFQSGTLDLMVGGTAGDQLKGAGGTWTYGQLGMSNMVPGSTVSAPITLHNSGTVDVTVTGVLRSTTNDLTGSTAQTGLSVALREGTASDCGGGSALPLIEPSTAGTSFVDAKPLIAGAETTYCATVTLGANAPSAMQGKTTNLIFAFTAEQVSP